MRERPHYQPGAPIVIPRILLVLLLIVCSCGGPGSAWRGMGDAYIAELIETERSFARYAAEKGTREAFLRYVSDDAVIFRPNPVNAKKWYEENTEGDGLLSWEPGYVEVSSSGDLGYITGPWEFRQSADDPEPASSGHYVSIWKRRSGGTWRLVLDLGNVHPRVANGPAGVESRVATPARPALSTEAALESERDVLLATDALFSEESEKKGVIAAYMSFSADDVRLYRMGQLPHQGKTRARKALMDISGTMTWEPMYADVSSAGDLGYTYGTAELRGDEPGAATETMSYARIWRVDPDGRWSVALDIALPSGIAAPEEDTPGGEKTPEGEGD